MDTEPWYTLARTSRIRLILLAMVLVMASIREYRIYWYHQSNTHVSQLDWPLPPPPDVSHLSAGLPLVTTLPDPPTKKEKVGSEKTSGGGILVEDQYIIDAVERLIDTHPDPSIRMELAGDIRSGRVLPHLTSDGKVKLRFTGFKGDETATLVVHRNLILDLTTDWSILQAQVTIFHHYQYYKHWDAGGLMSEMWAEEVEARNLEVRSDASVCQEFWELKLSAHAASCDLTNGWGFQDKHEICPYVHTDEWEQAVLLHMAEPAEGVSQTCQKHFADEAGYPG